MRALRHATGSLRRVGRRGQCAVTQSFLFFFLRSNSVRGKVLQQAYPDRALVQESTQAGHAKVA